LQALCDSAQFEKADFLEHLECSLWRVFRLFEAVPVGIARDFAHALFDDLLISQKESADRQRRWC